MQQKRILIALLAVASLVIASLSYLNLKDKSTWTLEKFNSQQLNWQDCYQGFECTTFQVPIDYAKLSGQRFTLKVLRHRALDQKNKLGAILVNPGGPGGSATDYAYNAESIVSPQINMKFDIVGFDPRGINDSQPIRCLTNTEEDAFLTADASNGDAKKLAKLIKLSQNFAAKCAKAAGVRLGHYSTLEAARDMEVLRNLLHEKKLNFLGKSYGTYLGTLYAALFPGSVGRMVLDGAVAPNISLRDQELAQTVGFNSALNNFLDSQDKFKLKEIMKLLAESTTKPLQNKSGRKAMQSLIITAIAQTLYNSDSGWKELRKLLDQAITSGNPDGIFKSADRYNNRDSSGNYYSNQNDISVMITCLDWPEVRSVKKLIADESIFRKASPVFGPYLSLASLSCKYWKAKPMSPVIKLNNINTDPILVIGVTADPATPFKWAQILTKSFTNAKLLTLKGEGHTGHNRGNKCVDTAVDTYFLTGKIGRTSLICAQSGN